jgi:hypothetical protein
VVVSHGFEISDLKLGQLLEAQTAVFAVCGFSSERTADLKPGAPRYRALRCHWRFAIGDWRLKEAELRITSSAWLRGSEFWVRGFEILNFRFEIQGRPRTSKSEDRATSLAEG